MHRKSAFAGLFIATLAALLQANTKVQAIELGSIIDLKSAASQLSVIEPVEKEKVEQPISTVIPEPVAVKEPEVVKYTVAEGDTLSKIAEAHSTTWKRIFDKNIEIQNPDIISVSAVVIIPAPDEVLAERALPEPPAPQPQPQPQQSAAPAPARSNAQPATAYRPAAAPSSAGNTYTAGYCTWYAKSRRPDLPNNLGNASTWVIRAQAQGLATGTVPRAGAIGQQGMHVVYIESVNADGSVNISEMNYRGLYIISTRTAPGSSFTYIY
jgi:surface antigen